MKTSKHTPAQIVEKLRRVEALTATGSTVADAIKKIEVTEQTYHLGYGLASLFRMFVKPIIW